MKAIGGLLLVLGITGLLLNLILWLPLRLNLIIMVLISVVCFVAIWGGGKLAQAKTAFVQEPAKKYDQRFSKPSGYNRRSPALNAVVKLSLPRSSAEAAVQAWHLIVPRAAPLLPAPRGFVGIVVPG
jgi:TRAP-type C4-dicarboxylate transport system permease small subunit